MHRGYSCDVCKKTMLDTAVDVHNMFGGGLQPRNNITFYRVEETDDDYTEQESCLELCASCMADVLGQFGVKFPKPRPRRRRRVVSSGS